MRAEFDDFLAELDNTVNSKSDAQSACQLAHKSGGALLNIIKRRLKRLLHFLNVDSELPEIGAHLDQELSDSTFGHLFGSEKPVEIGHRCLFVQIPARWR